jgi:hypothetical protein
MFGDMMDWGALKSSEPTWDNFSLKKKDVIIDV